MDAIHHIFKFFFRPTHPGFLYSLMQPVHQTLGNISSYKIAGIIPADIIAHLLLSAALAHLLKRMGVNRIKIILIILFLALFKEYFDSFKYGGISFFESFKDICITMIYPIFITTRRLKA